MTIRERIRAYSSKQAKAYNVNPITFGIIYILSCFPHFGGIALVGGDLTNISLGRYQTPIGLILTAVGWIFPYLYIEIKGKDLPFFIHAIVVVGIISFLTTCLCFLL